MATYTISSGAVSSGLNLLKGDSAIVLKGGTTVSTLDAGLELVSSGGIASGTTVLSGGQLTPSLRRGVEQSHSVGRRNFVRAGSSGRNN